MTTAWHYTTGEKFLSIVKSGFLLPATAGITRREHPVVWFSLNQEGNAADAGRDPGAAQESSAAASRTQHRCLMCSCK